MLHARLISSVLLVLGAAAAQADAQMVGPQGAAGADAVTVGLYSGGFSPSSTLPGDVSFRSSATVGGNAVLWVHPLIGARATALYARARASSSAEEPLAGERAHIFAYGGDLVLRLPRSVGNDRDSWFPYLVGGVGGKSYNFAESGSGTDLAGTVGAGIEYRFRRWGIQTEVRDLISRFDRLGIEGTQNDIVWTTGLTVSF